jgi:hypothetical protein
MIYQGSDKHKKPWQPGRKGSLCPPDLDMDQAQSLLLNSDLEGEKRYACRDGQAFCAKEHLPGTWHGWPVGWSEVPQKIRNRFERAGKVKRRDIQRNWN